MAKSLRSKTKRAFRRIKRESGVFAAADAARLHRVSSKLKAKIGTDEDGDVSLPQLVDDAAEGRETEEVTPARGTEEIPPVAAEEVMEIDTSATKKKSKSGRRLSRRDEVRLSKGKPLHRKNREKMNRLGGVAAKRKPGRAKRRR